MVRRRHLHRVVIFPDGWVVKKNAGLDLNVQKLRISVKELYV
jgi:hypothetical protein